MSDTTTTIESLKQLIKKFVDDREWQQYHSPKNLSMNIAIEAAELMEIFNWVDNEQSKELVKTKRTDIEHELADIAFGLLNFCMRYNIDLSEALTQKIALNQKKYPLELTKGNAKKYSEY